MRGVAGHDRRVGFERFHADARNALNEPEGGWLLLGETMAHRTDLRDSERQAAGHELSTQVARFVVRSTAITRSVTPKDRLVLQGQWTESGALISGEVWDILGKKEAPGERNQAIEITAANHLSG